MAVLESGFTIPMTTSNSSRQMPGSYSVPVRILLICGSTLVFLLLLFLGFQRSYSSSFQLITAPNIAPASNLLNDVFNQTLGFQKIIVINLPSRTDRRDSMSLAAALSGLQIEYIDGVTEVDNHVLPPGGLESNLVKGMLGSWRAHMNAIKMIVEQNLTSALVLEDDADWDIRIKEQMRDFAKASRLLVQPLLGSSDRFLDPTYPQPAGAHNQLPSNFDVRTEAEKDATSEPSTSPYGDVHRWDLLWLGHCGARFPRATDENVPIGRAVISNDQTVPEPQHIDMQFGNDELVNEYPAHTRVVSRSRRGTCTLGYGLSQQGARRFLYELGVHKMTSNFDIMFRQVCDGAEGRQIRTCLTVQPQLFQHHRPLADKATFSDISKHGADHNDIAYTRNIRWSMRLNFPNLLNGDTGDYVDLFKDGEEANPELGFG